MENSEMIQVTADVVVVGSGSAGGMAALAARWAGAEVALVDKAGIYRSGCGAAGEDHFTAVLGLEEWDRPEIYLRHRHNMNQGLCNPKLIENGFLSHIKWLVSWLEERGVDMRLDKENNAYLRTASFDMEGNFQINFDGRNLPPIVANEAKDAGVRFFPRTAVTSLLARDHQVVGAVGLQFRSGKLLVFNSKAVVLCTGNVGRIYDNHSGEPFNLWNCPYNTGLGHKVAFNAGARIGNMEFISFTVAPKNFGTPSMAAFTGMGAHIVNGAGERVAFNYHPKGEHAPRWALCQAVYRETQQGRGPIYLDVRHLPEKDLDHLVNHLLPVDKKSFREYLDQKGIDLSKDLLEVEVTGGEVGASSFQPNGVDVDESFMSSVPGLFGAGGVIMCPSGLPGSMTTGMAAGQSAARYAAGMNSVPRPDGRLLVETRDRIYALLGKKRDSLAYWEFEDKLRQIMSRYVRIGRTKKGLETALDELSWMEKQLPRLSAQNGHELMRCLEAQELLAVAKMIARGALVREESRFGLSHYRGDFPETREEWHKSVLQTKKGDGAEISYKPSYPLM